MLSVPKLAWVHYMTPCPVDVNDKPFGQDYPDVHYLVPNVEGTTDHRVYGAYARDWASADVIGARPRGAGYRLADYLDEIAVMQRHGIDGASVDLLSVPSTDPNSNWQKGLLFLQAAGQLGFKVLTMPDSNTGFGAQTATAMADALATLASYEATYKLPDGRLVVSPFHAENKTPAYWADVFTALKSKYNIDVAFWPTFLNYANNVAAFAAIPQTIGVGIWGDRSPTQQAGALADCKDAHARGLLWLAPVSVQDARPNQYLAYESRGTLTLTASWQSAIDGNADWVQMITWNDYSEGSVFAPSRNHGESFLTLTNYYLTTWKTGQAPSQKDDLVVVSHRKQLSTAQGTYVPPAPVVYKRMVARSGNTFTDEVVVTCILREQRALKITVGSKVYTSQRPIGYSTESYPLSVGNVLVEVSSPGVSYSVPGAAAVVAAPFLQDLQYVAASNTIDPWGVPDVTQAEADALTAENAKLQAELAQAASDLTAAQGQVSALTASLAAEIGVRTAFNAAFAALSATPTS